MNGRRVDRTRLLLLTLLVGAFGCQRTAREVTRQAAPCEDVELGPLSQVSLPPGLQPDGANRLDLSGVRSLLLYSSQTAGPWLLDLGRAAGPAHRFSAPLIVENQNVSTSSEHQVVLLPLRDGTLGRRLWTVNQQGLEREIGLPAELGQPPYLHVAHVTRGRAGHTWFVLLVQTDTGFELRVAEVGPDGRLTGPWLARPPVARGAARIDGARLAWGPSGLAVVWMSVESREQRLGHGRIWMQRLDARGAARGQPQPIDAASGLFIDGRETAGTSLVAAASGNDVWIAWNPLGSIEDLERSGPLVTVPIRVFAVPESGPVIRLAPIEARLLFQGSLLVTLELEAVAAGDQVLLAWNHFTQPDTFRRQVRLARGGSTLTLGRSSERATGPWLRRDATGGVVAVEVVPGRRHLQVQPIVCRGERSPAPHR